ncbi:outer membrane lipoprotein chaperone LolA [Curvibacter sp. RS43]|jgi:outer membrane lipoprotein carrier protein|uniref:outer membrane lipoprotein chaperone LolA n=1 Tax=Curvibacter microcysteis TaxID=3026419 RepID=UPI0023612DE5|nr:outer membrane lipoprotein chaperone LolA [Curvibacter sp. RS43]MDD0811917.1 outer membrane lipoprotein chaperone LolA [Curvibacter sp. RS43]
MKSRFLLLACLAGVSWSAWADGLQALESFVKNTRTGRAEFTQVVTAPLRDGQTTARSKSSTGSFEFQRPSHFRFLYRKPFEQALVADGQTVWLYDVDLNQVTARKQAQVLGSTPAALLASAPDLKALQADFKLSAAPEQDGQQWVQALPKARDAQIQSVRIGFRGEQLATLDILDSFGQRSVLSFTGFQANPVLPPETFQFKPPAGADVVRQ